VERSRGGWEPAASMATAGVGGRGGPLPIAMRARARSLESGAWRTIFCVLTVAEAADRLGRNPETVRRWIRSGRLPSRRVGAQHAIDDRDLRVIEDELHPMSELPEEWRVGDDGTPAPNWVAVLHRSRSGH
jgi:excisionase family DNA binding protein